MIPYLSCAFKQIQKLWHFWVPADTCPHLIDLRLNVKHTYYTNTHDSLQSFNKTFIMISYNFIKTKKHQTINEFIYCS